MVTVGATSSKDTVLSVLVEAGVPGTRPVQATSGRDADDHRPGPGHPGDADRVDRRPDPVTAGRQGAADRAPGELHVGVVNPVTGALKTT